MRIERLVAMANDISAFFAAEPDKEEAARSTASHITRFWDPRMRQQIAAHCQAGGSGLSEVARAAIALIDKRAMIFLWAILCWPALL